MTLEQQILAWLGYWRDKIPPEAVTALQNILKVKEGPAPAGGFRVH